MMAKEEAGDRTVSVVSGNAIEHDLIICIELYFEKNSEELFKLIGNYQFYRATFIVCFRVLP